MNYISSRIPVFLIIVLVLTACTGAVATEVSPAAIPPTDTPFPTKVPTESSTPSLTLLTFPLANCCRGRTLEAGKYEMPIWLRLPLSVKVSDGWKVMNEQKALLFLFGKGQNIQNSPNQLIVFLNVTDKISSEELIASVQQTPELTVAGEPILVAFAGFSGIQLDSAARPNPSYQGNEHDDIPPGIQFLPVFRQFFAEGFIWTTSSPEARIRTIVLMVKDQTLLLYLEAPPDEFDQFIMDADLIIRSLELTE